jgi:isoleucyl-tRNA synthetase
VNIPEIEKRILEFWKKEKIFEKSLEKESPKGDYVFYDGPPFATGTPHYGHIAASLIKDMVPRHWTMRGYRVERKWGWDCHGLPIENIVEKELKLKDKKDIERIGIDKFNEACRNKVLLYAKEWRKVIDRLGRWVDMDNDYKTMDLDFMESVWWGFKQLWDQKLIYEDYKSLHICPRCETTLSQSEVGQGYKNVKDIAVIAKFELEDEPGTFILAWTTTPWTLISNVALAVGKDIDYIKFSIKNHSEISDGIYVSSKKNFDDYSAGEIKILEKLKGAKLEGKRYKPLFDYYLKQDLNNKENLYSIQIADFVSTEEGTGIVHIAPAFGEDDMSLGKEKNLPFIQHVEMNGRIKKEAKDFADLEVKPKNDSLATDKKVVDYLKKKDLLFFKEEYAHSYPHCWRCEAPLLNYAANSWFVAVTAIKG